MAWIIYNLTDPDLCWSNGSGWTEHDYDTFDDIERDNLRLPMGGAWERVPWTKSESVYNRAVKPYNPMEKAGDL